MVEFGPNGQVAGTTVRPLAGRYRFLQFSQIAYVIANLGYFIVSKYEVSRGVELETTLVATINSAYLVVASLAYLACLVGLLVWTYRAMANLHTLINPFAKMSPGWAVGWYFIPIANLFKPLQGMVQIWDGSEDAASIYLPGRGRLVWWWGTAIAAPFITWVSVRLFGWEPVGQDYTLSLILDSASIAIELASIYFLLRITKQITNAQATLNAVGVEATFA